MKKILYVYNERDFHLSELAGRLIGQDLAADGRYELEMTTDLDAFTALPRGVYAAVVVYTTGCRDELQSAREAGLLRFVEAGGGFVGLHAGAGGWPIWQMDTPCRHGGHELFASWSPAPSPGPRGRMLRRRRSDAACWGTGRTTTWAATITAG